MIELTLLRHATLIVHTNSGDILLDPMFAPAAASDPIPNSPMPRRNPLMELPIEFGEFAGGVRAVMVTHTHSDHWDSAAAKLLPKDIPLFCQPGDEARFDEDGFQSVTPILDGITWQDLHITRTGGQHGFGDMAERMGKVSGFVINGSSTVYVAGDTVWCTHVQDAILVHRPEVIVLNAGAAQFNQGGPITMTAEDVIKVCTVAPEAKVIAVHMEAINHCILTRADLRAAVSAAGLNQQVFIPEDGERLSLAD
jgi:L-ascorbate metabolism protein UlaG (beta-lactamase superfamily)